MHTATKVMLILGGIITIVGIVMFVGGSAAASFDPIGDSEWDGSSGTFDGDTDIWYGAYAEASSCDDITYNLTDSDGYTLASSDEDEWSFMADCDDSTAAEDGYVSLGNWVDDGATVSVTASETIYIADVGEELGEAVGGFMAIMGSFGVLCCGGFFLLLGGIFALTLKEGGDTVVVVQGGGQQPMMAATGMAAPQYEQPVQYQQPPQGGM